MQVQLITPENTVFSGTAQSVNVPGTLGDFGVLPGHMPFVSTIRPGVVTIESDGQTRKVAVRGGIAEVMPDHCTVLAESALDCTSFTQADAQAKLAEAKSALATADNDADRKNAEVSVAMAEALTLINW